MMPTSRIKQEQIGCWKRQSSAIQRSSTSGGQGFHGELVDWYREQWGIELEILQKPAEQQGFVPLPRRWAVERSFAWYGRSRRLSKDYEHLELYSGSMVYPASIAPCSVASPQRH
jgi:putative transposase